MILEIDDTETLRASYIHGSGLDNPLAMTRSGQMHYYLADGSGSIHALVDSAGVVAHRYLYSAFGRITEEAGIPIDNPFTYTGRELDRESGLLYLRARYYDQTNGKFLSEDPIGFLGEDVNLLRHVRNNPINFIDPLGLKSWCNLLKEMEELKAKKNRYTELMESDDMDSINKAVEFEKERLTDVAKATGQMGKKGAGMAGGLGATVNALRSIITQLTLEIANIVKDLLTKDKGSKDECDECKK